MTLDGCAPCNCIPPTIGNDKFKQDVETILCAILKAILGGGGGGENVNVAAWGGVATSLGQKTMAASVPVVIASDQSSFNVAVTSVIPGTDSTDLGIAEDSPFVDGRTLVPVAVERVDVEGETTDTNRDASTLHEYDGRLSTTLRDRFIAGTLDMTSSGSVLTLDVDGMSSLALQIISSAATGTIGVKLSVDGTNYSSEIILTQVGSSSPIITNGLTAGTAAIFAGQIQGARKARVVVLSTGTGTASVILAAKAGQTTPTFLTSIFPGSSPTNLGKAEDGASASGDIGVMILAKQQATPTNDVTADADYQCLKTNVVGALYSEPSNQVGTYAASITAGAGGGVTTTGASVLTNSAKAKIITVLNTTDVLILISPDAGTTYPYFVSANGGATVLDLGANGRWAASNIFAKSVTSNSSSGSLYVGLTI